MAQEIAIQQQLSFIVVIDKYKAKQRRDSQLGFIEDFISINVILCISFLRLWKVEEKKKVNHNDKIKGFTDHWRVLFPLVPGAVHLGHGSFTGLSLFACSDKKILSGFPEISIVK